MSIADLQSGKEFKTIGVDPYNYKTKEDAIGYLNYYIGYILAVDKKDKKQSADYLFKASQTTSPAAKDPYLYQLLGLYYIDEFNKYTEDLDAKKAAVNTTDPEDVQAQKVAAVKAAVAQVNGAAERALDAYARAYNNTPKDEKNKTYRDGLYKKLQEIYSIRFGKQDGLDAWIATTSAKPLSNPSTPIAPVFDPEPAKTSTSGATTAPATTKPAGTAPVAKPDATVPAKPVAKPASAAKPQAINKKTVARRKGA
jgi:hypothetical protein